MKQDLSSLYQKLSEKYNLPVGVVEHVTNHQFKFMKEQLRQGNDVLLHRLGTFEKNKVKIYLKLERLIKNYREGISKREYFETRFREIWAMKNKLYE